MALLFTSIFLSDLKIIASKTKATLIVQKMKCLFLYNRYTSSRCFMKEDKINDKVYGKLMNCDLLFISTFVVCRVIHSRDVINNK